MIITNFLFVYKKLHFICERCSMHALNKDDKYVTNISLNFREYILLES